MDSVANDLVGAAAGVTVILLSLAVPAVLLWLLWLVVRLVRALERSARAREQMARALTELARQGESSTPADGPRASERQW